MMNGGEDCVMSNESILKPTLTNTPDYQIESSNFLLQAKLFYFTKSWLQFPPSDDRGSSSLFKDGTILTISEFLKEL